MPKPEEVPKKNKILETSKPKTSETFFFCFFGTSSGFGKIFTSRLWFFLVPPQVLAIFFLKTLPKPEEVPKKPKFLRPPSPRPPIRVFFCFFLVSPQVLARFSPLDFGCFGTSSGLGNIFLENLGKLRVFLCFSRKRS